MRIILLPDGERGYFMFPAVIQPRPIGEINGEDARKLDLKAKGASVSLFN
jgi:hypothetical protein